MAQKFYTRLTKIGQAKYANAKGVGEQINMTQLAVGDANGQPLTPDQVQQQEAMINQVRVGPINQAYKDTDNPNWLVLEQILPPAVGGWTIREVGIYDDEGDLVAYGNYPETYKPVLDEGSSRTSTVRFVLMVSDTSAVTLKVDPSVVLATRKYIDDKMTAHEKSRNHPYADTANQGMVKFATLQAAKTGTDGKTALAPAGGKAQLDDHRNETSAHKASQIPLDNSISGAKTVDEYAQRLNAAGAVQAQSINGQDMNNLTTSISFHHSYDDAPKNAPEAGAGVGWIIALGNGDRVSQYWHRASAGAANSVYVRSITAGQKWSEWGRLYTSDNIAQLVRDLGFRSDHSRDGYSVFPNGTVHQWGATSSLPDFETVITTPIRWPNAGRSIVASDNNDSNPDSVGIGFRGNDQLVIQTNDSGLIYWFAVGY